MRCYDSWKEDTCDFKKIEMIDTQTFLNHEKRLDSVMTSHNGGVPFSPKSTFPPPKKKNDRINNPPTTNLKSIRRTKTSQLQLQPTTID